MLNGPVPENQKIFADKLFILKINRLNG